MPSVKVRASKILSEYGEAQSELIGKVVVLADGKAGTVETVWLDELHGLRTNDNRRGECLSSAAGQRAEVIPA